MALLVLAVNPILAAWGQIAAIVICIFIFVFVLISLVFNIVMTFGLSWVRQKAELVKMLRPTVASLNKVTESVAQGVPPSENENALVRTVASLPARMQTVDKQVEQTSDRVAKTVIEFRARTVQAQTMLKVFFLPSLARKPLAEGKEDGLQFESPGYQMLMEEKAPAVPLEATSNGYSQEAQVVAASQLKDAPSR
ncbi:MAG TPA: hypothetical protein VFU49_04600 [Ktedonobacteraceae bacterium]|nr:hypothetical protein [Ktedonobacteraceae bacterium]